MGKDKFMKLKTKSICLLLLVSCFFMACSQEEPTKLVYDSSRLLDKNYNRPNEDAIQLKETLKNFFKNEGFYIYLKNGQVRPYFLIKCYTDAKIDLNTAQQEHLKKLVKPDIYFDKIFLSFHDKNSDCKNNAYYKILRLK